MLALYDFPTSPYCRRVHIVLAEKGLPYKRIHVDIREGDQRDPEYLKLNPKGKVPTLVDGDVVVYESVIINEYLEDKFPEPPLLPKDPGLRSRVRLLVDYCESQFTPIFRAYRREMQKPPEERNRWYMAQLLEEGSPHLDYLNRELKGKDYLVRSFSLADVAFAPRMLLLEKTGIPLPDTAKNLKEWVDRLKSRPSVQAL